MSGRRFLLLIVGLLGGTLLAVVFFVSATALVYAIGLGEARAIRIYTGLTVGSALVAAAGYVWLRNTMEGRRNRRDRLERPDQEPEL